MFSCVSDKYFSDSIVKNVVSKLFTVGLDILENIVNMMLWFLNNHNKSNKKSNVDDGVDTEDGHINSS